MPDATDQQIVQRIATKAVIVNRQGQVLILREANTYEEGTGTGRYHLPGGRLNPGEALFDGLTREVGEETGLEIKIGEPIFVGEWRPVIKGVQNQIVGIFFACMPTTEQVKLSEEHDSFEWVSAETMPNFDMMTPDDQVITKQFTCNQ